MNYRMMVGRNCYLDLDNDLLVKGIYKTPLSRMQVHIIHCLAENIGRPVSKERLIWAAWGTKTEGLPLKDELYVVMHRVRERLGDDPRHPKYLVSIKGFGYLLRPINTEDSFKKFNIENRSRIPIE